MSDGELTSTYPLREETPLDRSVPFFTLTTRDTGRLPSNSLVDVHVEDASGVIRFDRAGSAGQVFLTVSVVVFDPAFVRVRRGEFRLEDQDVLVELDGVALPANTFTTFSHTYDGTTSDRPSSDVLASLTPSGGQMHFQRTGTEGTVEGHWWAVEALSGEFSVQRPDIVTIADTESGQTITPSKAFSEDHTFFTYSARSHADTDEPAFSNVACAPDGGLVRCTRRGTRYAVDVGLEIVSLNAPAQRVLRGSRSLLSTTHTVVIPGIDVENPTRAMTHGGRLGRVSGQPTNILSEPHYEASFIGLRLTENATRLEVSRRTNAEGATTPDSENPAVDVAWQVIEW